MGEGSSRASMGPRSCDRGENASFAAYDSAMDLLQWGRGRVTAESIAEKLPHVLRRHASMGPRSCDRGETNAKCGYIQIGCASMGPRSCDRGEHGSRKCHRRGNSRLQWGRGRVTAESWDAGGDVFGFLAASMGPRSCDRGEDQRREAGRPRCRSFNGAAVV